MANRQTLRLYVYDTQDGKVGVSGTMPTIPIEGPIQVLTVSGPIVNPNPPSPAMSQDEFRQWRESLEDSGCDVGLDYLD